MYLFFQLCNFLNLETPHFSCHKRNANIKGDHAPCDVSTISQKETLVLLLLSLIFVEVAGLRGMGTFHGCIAVRADGMGLIVT